MSAPVLALVESNTTGTGRLFASVARRRGLRPVLLSTRPDRYPWVAEDGVEIAWADTTDPEAVARVGERLSRAGGLAGVVTSSEYFVVVAARAASRLGLPGAPPAALEQCRDKRRQRMALHRAGVPVPAFEAVGSVSAAVGAASDLGLPVVLKPADGTGSRGVRLCHDIPSVGAHARRLLSRRHDERSRPTLPWLLVERYVGGPEVSVETFGADVIGVTAKHLGPLPDFVETGHDFPDRSPNAGTASAVAEQAVAALGVGWGPAHTEVRLGPDGPVVIEVNPRLAGGRIPILVRLATGIDLVAATVDLAAGDEPDLGPPGPGHASIRFLVAPRAGRLMRVEGLAAAAAVAGVCDVALTAAIGGDVGGTGSFLDRIGYVVAAGSDAAGVRRAVERAHRSLAAVLDDDPGERSEEEAAAAARGSVPSAAGPARHGPAVPVPG